MQMRMHGSCRYVKGVVAIVQIRLRLTRGGRLQRFRAGFSAARLPTGPAACYGALAPPALPRQFHLKQRQQQGAPVLDRPHDTVDFEAVSPVVHLKLMVAATALEQEPRVFLPLPAPMKSAYGEVAVYSSPGKPSIHS